MSDVAISAWLSTLDDPALTALLRARPDVLRAPAPRGLGDLAQRLASPASLGPALGRLDRDAVLLTQVLAIVGPRTRAQLAELVSASPSALDAALGRLLACGVAYLVGDEIGIPERLAAHWQAQVGQFRPAGALARAALADDVRTAAAALGVNTELGRKTDVAERWVAQLADTGWLREQLGGLPAAALGALRELRRTSQTRYYSWPPRRSDDRVTLGTGLAVRIGSFAELPLEVACALWLGEQDLRLTGAPVLPPAVAADGAPAAVQFLATVTALLDHAAIAPLPGLKRGGIGVRTRTKLAERLSVPVAELDLAIDLAWVTSLLTSVMRPEVHYLPSAAFSTWREQSSAQRWAQLAVAWLGLEHAATARQDPRGNGKDIPPPLVVPSAAGLLRRSLLAGAGSGVSLRAAAAHVAWFCPLVASGSGVGTPDEGDDPYDDDADVDDVDDDGALAGWDDGLIEPGESARRAMQATTARETRAALDEAELLGVAAGDALTALGQQLLAAGPQDPVGVLVAALGGMLPEPTGSVILQSDLTAVVSGQVDAAAAGLLAAAAVSENRSSVALLRFSPASVRAAMDRGWTAEELVEGLEAMSGRALPQPLAYLIADAARRYGEAKVQELRSCVLATPELASELANTKALRALGLRLLAPTVLASDSPANEVLDRLRAAGFSPVLQGSDGSVVLAGPRSHAAGRVTAPASREVVDPVDLARALRGAPRRA